MSVLIAMCSAIGVVFLPVLMIGAPATTKRHLGRLWVFLLIVLLVSIWLVFVQYPCPKYC